MGWDWPEPPDPCLRCNGRACVCLDEEPPPELELVTSDVMIDG